MPTSPAAKTPTRRLAIAVSAQFPDLREDWPLLRNALRDVSVAAETAVWSDPSVRWEEFDLVVANGAWDNISQPDAFLAWVTRCAAHVRIVNSPDTLRWNLDKRYLQELSDRGVPTVPTCWLANEDPLPPGAVAAEFVVKPTISGGGFQSARYHPDEYPAAVNHITELWQAGRDVMVQPYIESVDRLGEIDLIFLGGSFSHAVSKSPMLRARSDPRPTSSSSSRSPPPRPLPSSARSPARRWRSRNNVSVPPPTPASTS